MLSGNALKLSRRISFISKLQASYFCHANSFLFLAQSFKKELISVW